MSVVWGKVWRDLAHNKARTTLAVLSTAVGIFALGLVFGLSGVMHMRMTEAQRAAIPAHISFWGGPFSPDIVDAVRREPGVLDAEGAIVTSFRWKFVGEETWRDGEVIARADYGAQRMNLIRLLDGYWPTKRVLGVERLSSKQLGVLPGTTILIEFGGRERGLLVDGVLQAHAVLAPEWGGEVTFFATPEAVAWLTGREYGEDFNWLHVRLEAYSQEVAEETAERVKDRLERIGLSVKGYEVTAPDVHLLQDTVDGVLIILAIMGGLSLGLSAFLIFNTMNAIIAQQVWQIGMMKAVGATVVWVVGVYLATALIYGGLALLLAVPLGAVSAHLLAVWLLDLFNVGTSTFQIEPVAIGIQMTVGVVVPVLAALMPVWVGARVTVREAIGAYGIGSGFGRGWLDRLIGRIRSLPPSMALSLRNTFRRKARVALTLVTLTLSGAMFMMVMSTVDSFGNTIRPMLGLKGDVSISLDRPHRISRLIEIAEGVPGVTGAEVWSGRNAMLSLATDPACTHGVGTSEYGRNIRNRRDDEERPVYLRGAPSGSAMFNPRIVSGRSLLDSDGYAVIINHRVAEEEGIQLGDEVTLTIDGEESVWTVVGSYLDVDSVSDKFFVPFDALARETGTLGRGEKVMVLSEGDDVESHQRLIKALTDAFATHRIEVVGSWSASKQWEETQAAFGVLIYLLLTMTVLTALVGSIGLMSTTSINVVERAREIGVMRAIGATSLAIVGVFVAESVLVGVLSWLLAVPLSYPGALLFSNVIGEVVFEVPLEFAYSMSGMALWLLIVIVLSALASLWPALRAAQLSVREALAYE